MVEKEIQTRFGTYECLYFSEKTHLILNRVPKLSKIEPKQDFYFIPPWIASRQIQIDNLYMNFPHKDFLRYCNGLLSDQLLEPDPGPLDGVTFRTLVQKLHLPETLRPTWLSKIRQDYYVILQLGGLIYDLCRVIRRAGEYGIIGIHHGVMRYFGRDSSITEEESEVLLVITRLYYEATALSQTSTCRFAELIAVQDGIPVDQLFQIIQAIAIAYEGPKILPRFRMVDWYLSLITNGIRMSSQVARYVKIYRISPGQSTQNLCFIPMTEKNLITLIEDPVSSFARPIEFEDYFRLTGRHRVDLRRELLEIIIDQLEEESVQLKSVRNEIYDWYQSEHPNKLSQKSLADLIVRLSQYPRRNWDQDRIIMTARRLSSANYSLDDLINEYDQDYTEMLIAQKETQLRRCLAPFVPNQGVDDMTSDQAFQIPILSPRGLLLTYSILKEEVPIWFNRLLAHSMKSVVSDSSEFPGLYGHRYGINGIITMGLDRVIIYSK